MRRVLLFPLGVALLSGSLSPALDAGSSHHSLTISTEGDDLARCEDIDIRFGDGKRRQTTARAEQTLTATESQLPVLRSSGAKSGGISVRGATRNGYAITVCKAAGGSSQTAAEATLERVRASITDGKIVVDGPANDDWVAFILVEAPEKAAVELEAANGSIALRGLTGRIRVRTENGPVSLRDCSGDIEVDADNGPISYSGSAGRVTLRAENGPIAVDLAGAWEGERLEARTQNGPLALKVPSRPSSGIRIESSEHAPWSCKAEACRDARKTWDDEHRILEFGGAPASVRLSTVNGPVSVESIAYE